MDKSKCKPSEFHPHFVKHHTSETCDCEVVSMMELLDQAQTHQSTLEKEPSTLRATLLACEEERDRYKVALEDICEGNCLPGCMGESLCGCAIDKAFKAMGK